MRNVNRVVGKDGVERLYFRKRGAAAVRLTGVWGTPELEAEVKALLEAQAPKPLPGTLRGALRAYELENPDFKNLADSTKYEYRLMMRELGDDLGDLPYTHFTPGFVFKLRNEWASRGHRAANNRLLLLRHALTPSIIAGRLDNPFTAIPQVRRPANAPEPHILWSAETVAIVIEGCIAQRRYGVARAVALARYTGARRGDLVKIGRGAIQGGRVRFKSGKRKVPVDIREDPHLTSWLERIPAAQPQEPRRGRKVAGETPAPMTLVFNLANRPYTEDGLGQELADVVVALHGAGKIDSDAYGLHGLRHTRGVELALAGCTDAQGAAMMGHASASSFAQYRRQADRIMMSDDGADKVIRLRERTPNGNVQNELQNSCKTDPASVAG
jgi:integrase